MLRRESLVKRSDVNKTSPPAPTINSAPIVQYRCAYTLVGAVVSLIAAYVGIRCKNVTSPILNARLSCAGYIVCVMLFSLHGYTHVDILFYVCTVIA